MTKLGQLRAPNYKEVLKWILKAWDLVDNVIIKNSFQYCALSVRLGINQRIFMEAEIEKEFYEILNKKEGNI